MKRSLLALLLATTFAIAGTNSTYALHSTDSLAAREQTTRPMEEVISDDKKLELETRKQELEEKLEEKRAAITTKLMGERAEKCQKKEVNINAMLDKRVESAQKHFDTFQSVHTRLTTLVKEKEIMIDNQNARLIIINDYEVDAQAAIDDMKKADSDFKCGDADATAPGAIVKSQITTVKEALKNYRDSIKEYAQSIKDAVEATNEQPVDKTPTEQTPVQETPSTEQSIEGVSR